MNTAAKELPVSYDLSKPQEDREPYIGSVLFFKHVIFTVTLLLILIPTTLSIYLFAQVRSLSRQLDAAGSQLAAIVYYRSVHPAHTGKIFGDYHTFQHLPQNDLFLII